MASKTAKTMSTELQDRMDDLHETKPGNVHAQATEALNASWEHLHDYSIGRGTESLSRAGEALDNAIEVLAFLRARIRRLDEEEGAKMIARWEARKTA
ncbi:MAG TPA: hypothetical protein VIL79_07335 [Thermoleophilia bacterium]